MTRKNLVCTLKEFFSIGPSPVDLPWASSGFLPAMSLSFITHSLVIALIIRQLKREKTDRNSPSLFSKPGLAIIKLMIDYPESPPELST
ncbi:hypothetical protein ACHHRT_04795 [Desulfurivibrio sp. D14AmB]|uniref:hypothetical protein n=1 Tax=Desulfurivibrio sp. D14AmB TaxID=3374370 RepID=UPI00376EC394